MLLELLDVHDELVQFPCNSWIKDTMLDPSHGSQDVGLGQAQGH